MINCFLITFVHIVGAFFSASTYTSKIDMNEILVHPFHLSKCHIKYKELDRTLELSLVLFVDDFEDALKEISTDGRLNLCNDLKKERTLKLIEQYLYNHLSINDTHQQLPALYIGSECSNNGLTIWSYIEYKTTEIPKSIHIKNDILISLFADQKNIVDVELSKGHLVERLMTNQLTEATFD